MRRLRRRVNGGGLKPRRPVATFATHTSCASEDPRAVVSREEAEAVPAESELFCRSANHCSYFDWNDLVMSQSQCNDLPKWWRIVLKEKERRGF